MKKKGKAAASLVASAILAASIYLGSCEYLQSNTDTSDNKIVNSIMFEEVLENENTYNLISLSIDDSEFQEFEGEKFFTLFNGTQLYDYALHGFNISPDVVNKKTITVKGISTNGELTLIELPNGEQKYVSSNDIIETISVANTSHNGYNDDYTVNKDAYVYNREGVCIGYINEGTRCLEIAFNDNYSFVITENDEYFYISHDDITLTDKYHKGLFKPKKLEKSPSSLDIGNIWFQDGQYSSNITIYRVYPDDEPMVESQDKPYYTLMKKQPIYFNNGNLSSISYDKSVLVRVLKENSKYSLVELPDGSTGYINKQALTGCLILDNNSFTPILRNRNSITSDWDFFYDDTGAYQYSIYPNTECTSLATNGEYTLIELEDGTKGYVTSAKLIESEHQVSRFVYLKDNATLYYKNQNDELVPLNTENKKGSITYLFYIDGDYAYIGDYYCRENYFVKLSDIDENYNITEVNSYAYVTRDQQMNSDINQNGQNYNVDDYDLYWVYYNCGDYSYVVNEMTHESGYIKTSELNYLHGDFIFIDLDNQQMYCYDDNDGGRYTTKQWGTRSGKDSTPSHEGAFDIDWKAENWEFTTFRGSYAQHWIPYNEYGEGIHDLMGDDEQNYGNQAYHQYGSHGCVRVPAEASKYVFENYPIGSMVLVQKK